VNIQKDRLRFRKNILRIGEVIAYEISKTLRFRPENIETSLGTKSSSVFAEQPVICSVLRAGLPFQLGLLEFFDRADAAFISAYRRHTSETEFVIVVEYLASPNLNERLLILADPMLATGHSLVATYNALLKNGTPGRVIVAGLIASEAGLNYVREQLPHADIFLADCDPDLNEHAYIVPGLGDAGDLAFGEKL
ncbi:MAG: uracil phosphoribosyltransferase, partial [Bacteroidota bacterium]|nr:uracil phosphoribosyltransferase [Bacteroidota bacterium]MDX5429645.1 uracil phosphoribosyltransferase [Bacteroidota bacterium]MDX5468426.1 uracil phosphoribosyltransferase [Bacteroidota bacterium]